MVKALLEQISKDKEKFLAFMDYLIETGRLTEDEVIEVIRQSKISELLKNEKTE
ncbi:hypothetical protein [Desulforamulus reducens]|uniref:hypothetical protein n=1 Tax=Desulforamulus reducens TaxID=59610 RepID=UPI0002DEC45C|nr:hypothetical protein [Desulforamulus reducens]